MRWWIIATAILFVLERVTKTIIEALYKGQDLNAYSKADKWCIAVTACLNMAVWLGFRACLVVSVVKILLEVFA